MGKRREPWLVGPVEFEAWLRWVHKYKILQVELKRVKKTNRRGRPNTGKSRISPGRSGWNYAR